MVTVMRGTNQTLRLLSRFFDLFLSVRLALLAGGRVSLTLKLVSHFHAAILNLFSFLVDPVRLQLIIRCVAP